MNGSKNNIVAFLAHRDDYISGEIISDAFGISRAAVWKHIKKLKEEGYKIDSIRNKGYKLESYPEQFVMSEIQEAIAELGIIDKAIILSTVDSTNLEAKRLATIYPNQQLLIISEEQTAGIGRRGRVWQSEKGKGIYMSMLIRPNFSPEHASKMTLLAGLAVNEAINEVTGLVSAIKWPNDIVINGKKVCGILTEMSTEMNEIKHLVVGIGINVNHEEFDGEINGIASSLGIEKMEKVDRKKILTNIVKRFAVLYKTFQETLSLDFMIGSYNDQCITVNQIVQVIRNNTVQIGEAIQVTNDGGIEVKFDNHIEIIQSGEVSIRGLYGYIE